MQAPSHTGPGVKQAYRTGRQIASVFVGFPVAVHQSGLQLLKIAGADERLAGDHQTVFVLDTGRNSADGAGVVGHDLSHIAVAPGGRLHQLAALIGQLDGQAVQFKHEHHLMLTHKAAQFLRILHFVQGQQRDR